jgi:hypothetical protein
VGIFYNPPHQTSYPNIGGQQPLTPSKIAANPATYFGPYSRKGISDAVQTAINDSWYNPSNPFITLLLDGNTEPYQGAERVPPSGPTPPLRSQQVIYDSWNYPQNPFVTLILDNNAEPYQGPTLTPAITAPAPPAILAFEPTQLLSIIAAYTSNPFLTLLLDSNSEPYQGAERIPPSAPSAFSPFVQSLQAVYNSWLPSDLILLLDISTEPYQGPILPPPSGFTPPPLFPWAIYNSWNFQPFFTLLLDSNTEPYGAPQTIPPSGFTPAPTFPWPIYHSWNYPLNPFLTLLLDTNTQPYQGPVTPQPPVANPPPPTNITQILSLYQPEPLTVFILEIPTTLITFFPPVIGSSVPVAVLVAWQLYQYALYQQAFHAATLLPVPTPPPAVSNYNAVIGISNSWIAANYALYQQSPPVKIPFPPPIKSNFNSFIPINNDWLAAGYVIYQQSGPIAADVPVPTPPPPGANATATLPGRFQYSDFNVPPLTWMGAEQPHTPSKIVDVLPPITNPPPGANAIAASPVRLWYGDYNPPPPVWMGAEQPWTPNRLADVLPVPTPPPVVTATAIPQTIYGTWYYQPPLILLLGPGKQPFSPAQLTPPSGAAAPTRVPQSNAMQAILAAWEWQTVGSQPQTLPLSIQQVAKPFLAPPSIQAILDSWRPAPPPLPPLSLIAASIFTFPSPPPVIGSRVPAAVLDAWIPPDQNLYQFQPSTTISPTLPIPTPPPVIGSSVAQAILDSWYYQPLPLPQFSGSVTVGPVPIPIEIIRATVTVTAQSAATLIRTYGANVKLDT